MKMDIATMIALGFFDDDEEDEEKGRKSMTDQQFKAFMGMCLVLANNTNEVKDFKKRMAGAGCLGAEGTHSVFGNMLVQIAESAGDMDSVRKVLQVALEGLRT